MKYGTGIIYRMTKEMAAELRNDYKRDKRLKNAPLEKLVDDFAGLLRPCEKVEII